MLTLSLSAFKYTFFGESRLYDNVIFSWTKGPLVATKFDQPKVEAYSNYRLRHLMEELPKSLKSNKHQWPGFPFPPDLSARVDAVKEENLKLKSENQVLGQYIENLMSASSVFQTTDTKGKRKWCPERGGGLWTRRGACHCSRPQSLLLNLPEFSKLTKHQNKISRLSSHQVGF